MKWINGWVFASLLLGGCYEGVDGPRGTSVDVRQGVFLIDGQYQQVTYEVGPDGQAVLEGDILLGQVETLTAVELGERDPDRAAVLSGSQWPGGVVPYVIDGSLADNEVGYVKDAIELLESETAVQFVERTDEDDYVLIVGGPACASSIGRRGGEQGIVLSSLCAPHAVVHELLHTLGLFHEQSRIDRDEHVEIHWDEIEAGKEHNFQTFLEQPPYKGADIGNYDYGSIMHYNSWAFSRSEKPTITRLDGGVIFTNKEMSDGDLAAVNAMYPPTPVPTPCGDVDFHGRCDSDSQLTWCQDNVLHTYDCSEDWAICQWQDDKVGYNCVPTY